MHLFLSAAVSGSFVARAKICIMIFHILHDETLIDTDRECWRSDIASQGKVSSIRQCGLEQLMCFLPEILRLMSRDLWDMSDRTRRSTVASARGNVFLAMFRD